MRLARSIDTSDLGIAILAVAPLVYAALAAKDPAITVMCISPLALLFALWRKTKTVSAQLIEIVDEQGYTRGCIGYTGGGLSFAVSKAEVQNGACMPLSLFPAKEPFVQYTIGANLSSTAPESHQTPTIVVLDSSRSGSFRAGLSYMVDGEIRIGQYYIR